jgi:proteasome lid subunit RPN8/RPN11
MSFSILTTIRALLAPDHHISCRTRFWRRILRELELRGEGRHESGAFLLGEKTGGRLRVRDVVFYDELDPNAYSTGVCVLHGEAFAKLWTICRERQLTVVGDVHTHPGAARQSEYDRTNPMVARAGHVAVIVSRYAQAPIVHAQLGLYEYCGGHTWHQQNTKLRGNYFYTGWLAD